MNRTAILTAILISITWSGWAAAQDVEQQLSELRSRIESLERENFGLRQGLASGGAGPEFVMPADTDREIPLGMAVEQRLAELEAKLAAHADQNETADFDSESHEVGSDLRMSASWNHGLELATKSKDFRVHVGGRTQFDAGWFHADQNVQDNINLPYQDGIDFRRGRLRVDGTMYATIDWAVEYDFFNAFRIDEVDRTVTAPTDLWWTFKEVPWVGNVRIGNQKPAIGFEHLVSSRFLPFMERSYNQDAFYGGAFNGFWPGISLFDSYGWDDIGTWNVGVFRPTNNVFAFNATDGEYALVGRLTRLMWYECEGESLMHLGISASQHTTVNDRAVFRSRDAVRTGLASSWPIPATTGTIAGDDMQWFNAELAAVQGPVTFQAEYLASYLHDAAPIIANVVQPSVGTVLYHGGYAQVMVFLTGEHDHYNKKTGVFERVTPRQNFFLLRDDCGNPGGGFGAWQIGARYNCLDLNDNGLDGGILHNATAGVNWFLNPNMKVQFNYMATYRDAPLAGGLGDGWIHGFGTRLAHDF